MPSYATAGVAAALNNSAAGISQIIAQWIWIAGEADRGYPTGNFVCAGCSAGTVGVALGLRWWYGRMNREGVRDSSGRERVWVL